MAASLNGRQRALLDLLRLLDARGYAFTTITPASHRRVLDRDRSRTAGDLRDVFGWSLPARAEFEPQVRRLLEQAELLREEKAGWSSRVRVSRVGGHLFLHSSYPTREKDAVFLGPDTYRFVRFLQAHLSTGDARSLIDIGAGAGVGGVISAGLSGAAEIRLTDVNPRALELAAVNAAHAGLEVELVETSGLDGVEAKADLIIANPPFMNGAEGKTYSSGGDMHGGQMSVDWARSAARRLAPGGRILLYSGSAIVGGGIDRMKLALEDLAQEADLLLRYEEIDPDIFGEVLGSDDYADVERIAAVAVELRRQR